MKAPITLCILLIAFGSNAQHLAQNTDSQISVGRRSGAVKTPNVLLAHVLDGDTVPTVNLPLVRIVDNRTFKSAAESQKYNRLKRDVLKVYPYAKLAGDRLRAYNDTLMLIRNEGKRRVYMHRVEEDLQREFGDQLKSLSINQGRILIKLVDRQTGDTSYELVKDLRGTFSAFFWQTAARIFGHNLKSQYDKDGEDRMIEDIVVLIESGELK